MGNRFRLVVNTVNVVASDQPMPNLPVARVMWQPEPDLKIAAEAWILAGAAHHSGFSQEVRVEHLEDFAEMAGIEMLLIDSSTRIGLFKNEIRWNDVYYSGK